MKWENEHVNTKSGYRIYEFMQGSNWAFLLTLPIKHTGNTLWHKKIETKKKMKKKAIINAVPQHITSISFFFVFPKYYNSFLQNLKKKSA